MRGILLGPYNKDYSIFGSILGYPNFGKLPNAFVHFELLLVTPGKDWLESCLLVGPPEPSSKQDVAAGIRCRAPK